MGRLRRDFSRNVAGAFCATFFAKVANILQTSTSTYGSKPSPGCATYDTVDFQIVFALKFFDGGLRIGTEYPVYVPDGIELGEQLLL